MEIINFVMNVTETKTDFSNRERDDFEKLFNENAFAFKNCNNGISKHLMCKARSGALLWYNPKTMILYKWTR